MQSYQTIYAYICTHCYAIITEEKKSAIFQRKEFFQTSLSSLLTMKTIPGNVEVQVKDIGVHKMAAKERKENCVNFLNNVIK